jgi:hypothetical protein
LRPKASVKQSIMNNNNVSNSSPYEKEEEEQETKNDSNSHQSNDLDNSRMVRLKANLRSDLSTDGEWH